MKRTQQEAIYDAEASVPCGRRFGDVAEAQAYLDSLAASDLPWWPENLVRVEVVAQPTRSKESCAYHEPDLNCGVIQLSKAGLDELTVCHELSHILASIRYRTYGHDPAFARVYLETIYRVMGSDTYLALFNAFRLHNINTNPS